MEVIEFTAPSGKAYKYKLPGIVTLERLQGEGVSNGALLLACLVDPECESLDDVDALDVRDCLALLADINERFEGVVAPFETTGSSA